MKLWNIRAVEFGRVHALLAFAFIIFEALSNWDFHILGSKYKAETQKVFWYVF